MSDLIDRQAAIDAIRIFYADECALVDSIEEQLEKLPSAQPERKPGKTLAEEVERIKREITDIFAEQMSAQPRHYHEENLLAYAHDMGVTIEQAKKELTKVTQIEPQRMKGRWVRKESDLSWWYECSKCGESPLFDPYEHEVQSPFCPWCGAKMEVEHE